MFNKRKASGNKTFNKDGFADYNQLISPANNHHSSTLKKGPTQNLTSLNIITSRKVMKVK